MINVLKPLFIFILLSLSAQLANAQWTRIADADTGWYGNLTQLNNDTAFILESKFQKHVDDTFRFRFKTLTKDGVVSMTPECHVANVDSGSVSVRVIKMDSLYFCLSSMLKDGFHRTEIYKYSILTNAWELYDQLEPSLQANGLKSTWSITILDKMDTRVYLGGWIIDSLTNNTAIVGYDLPSKQVVKVHRLKHNGSLANLVSAVVYKGVLYGNGYVDSVDNTKVSSVFTIDSSGTVNDFTPLSFVLYNGTFTGTGDNRLRYAASSANDYTQYLWDGSTMDSLNLNDASNGLSAGQLNQRIKIGPSGQIYSRVYQSGNYYFARFNEVENKFVLSGGSTPRSINALFYLGDTLYSYESAGSGVQYIMKLSQYAGRKVHFRFFMDYDSSCTSTTADTVMYVSFPLRILNDESFSFNSKGSLTVEVLSDTVEFEVPQFSEYLRYKDCQNRKVAFGSADSIGIDLYFTPTGKQGWDVFLYTNRGGWRARQGFTEEYQLKVRNLGFEANSCTLNLKLPSTFQYKSAIPEANDEGGNVYSWPISLGRRETKVIPIMIKNPLSGSVFQPFILNPDVNCSAFDTDTFFMRLLGAYDPNDKQSDRDTFMRNRLKRKIRYMVRFQNTGTDTAYNIRIIDTLDRNLPVQYMQIVSSSHPYTQIKALPSKTDNKYYLEFEFDNILLPDSGKDYDGSQGYILYETKLAPGFTEKDSILNTAHIYFDYQPAIVTNTVMNKYFIPPADTGDVIDTNTTFILRPDIDEEVVIYPNPAQNECTIKNIGERQLYLALYDPLGRKVREIILTGKESKRIPLMALNPGMYMIQSRDGRIMTKLIVLNP